MDSIIDRNDKQRSNQNETIGVSYQLNLQFSESMAKQKL